MPKLDSLQRFPTVRYNQCELAGVADYSAIILAKKRDKGTFLDRVMAETGEAAVDFIMESMNVVRKWMRGRVHYDFTNLTEEFRLEVKTRKMYTKKFEDLDVRLDFSEYESAKEATHLVPLVYNEVIEGADIISPGVFDLQQYIKGCETNGLKPDPRLKRPAFRTTWELVLSRPTTYGFKPWKEFFKLW